MPSPYLPILTWSRARMVRRSRSARTVLPVVLAMACAGHFPESLATPPSAMTSGSYAIRLEGAQLPSALSSVAAAFDLRLQTSGELSGKVWGTYKTRSASAFLDELAQRHGFVWFVHGDRLYASSSSALETVRIPVGVGNVEAARSVLGTNRLSEAKFGWTELAEEGAVQVSGPPDYIRLVRAALKPLEDSAKPPAPAVARTPESRPEVMVFRLRNANAEDRTVTFRNQTIAMPGLATILRSVLNGNRFRRPGMWNGPGLWSSHGRPSIPEAVDSAVAGLRGAQGAARLPARGPVSGASIEGEGAPGADAISGGPSQTWISIEADQRINAILVVDMPDRRAYYERLIAELDVAQQLIEIEALIIDIDRQLLSELGVEWSAKGAHAGYSGALSAVAGLASTTFVIPDFDKFFARLRALDTAGKAVILAKPSVLTLDNQAAVLDLSTTDYIRLVGERAVDVKEVTAGTLLRVVPRVQDAGQSASVQMLIDIEDGFLAEGASRGVPTVQRSTISTQAAIDIGQSLVIGGYRSSQQRSETNKIPVLGDLPVVGGVFRSTRAQDRNMERLFIITPRPVGPGIRFPAAARTPVQDTAEEASRRIGMRPPSQLLADEHGRWPGAAAPLP